MTRFGVIGLSPRQEQPGMDAIDRQDSLPRASFDRYRPEGDLQVGPMNGQKARESGLWQKAWVARRTVVPDAGARS
jgi:hypothetical protein